LQTLKTLVRQCNSIAEIESVSSTAGQVQELLQMSIDKLQFIVGPQQPTHPLPISTVIRKRKMSPQKSSTSTLLALARRSKKKKGLSTPEKEANTRVQEKLKQLNRVTPLCVVCEAEYDLLTNHAEKCSKCDRWCHVTCIHICFM
jgi:hypothetical protein